MATLVFIYNANSGKINAAFDIAHKLISPSTYQCQLCSITHSAFNERAEWKSFREQSEHKCIFYHKDEFEQAFSQRFTYPVILLQTNSNEFTMLINAESLATCPDSNALIKKITEGLAKH